VWHEAEAGQARTWGRCDDRRAMAHGKRRRGWPGWVRRLGLRSLALPSFRVGLGEG
jgi:hypothetical protein